MIEHGVTSERACGKVHETHLTRACAGGFDQTIAVTVTGTTVTLWTVTSWHLLKGLDGGGELSMGQERWRAVSFSGAGGAWGEAAERPAAGITV